MTVRITTKLKCLLPGYRENWYRRATVFLREVDAILEQAKLDWDGAIPVAHLGNGISLAGMVSTQKDEELYYLLKPRVGHLVELSQFRLVRDLITRYRYPHLRPDLSPNTQVDASANDGLSGTLTGFHGQHKDTLREFPDGAVRERYVDAFGIKVDDVILDCGAFIGFGEVALSAALPEGRIIALEANRACHDLAKHNISGNGLDNITLRHNAIWKTHGDVLDLATGEAQANTLLEDVYDGGGRSKVTTANVDGIVSDENLGKLNMLSLTVNGAEVEALEGATRTLEKLRPRIRLAGWYERNGVPVANLCRELLEAADYHVWIGPKQGVLALPKEALS